MLETTYIPLPSDLPPLPTAAQAREALRKAPPWEDLPLLVCAFLAGLGTHTDEILFPDDVLATTYATLDIVADWLRDAGLPTLADTAPDGIAAVLRLDSAGDARNLLAAYQERAALRTAQVAVALARNGRLESLPPPIPMPALTGARRRPLLVLEHALLRLCALGPPYNTYRRPVVVAFSEATAGTGELGMPCLDDISLDAPAGVRLAGNNCALPRTGALSEWGEARVREMCGLLREAAWPADRPVLYVGTPRKSAVSRHATLDNVVIELLTKAGLGSDPDVRPMSVRNGVGRMLLARDGDARRVQALMGWKTMERAATELCLPPVCV